MTYDYVISLKNDRGKYITAISLLLCLMSAFFFLAQQIRYGKGFYYMFLVSFCLIAGGITWNIYISTKQHRIAAYRRLLILAGVTWIYMPFMQWLAAPIILLAFLEKSARSPLEIGIASDHIVFNSLIKREFQWTAFSNVMLKDSLLTLDFKNNRLFQKETVDETSEKEEAEFNEYCKMHLTKAVPELT